MTDDRFKAYGFEQLRFLLVDDNQNMRLLIRNMLAARGCRQIVDAGDGAEALKRLQSDSVDFIICDWAMAPMDGIEFTRRLRTDAKNPNRRVPIIMLSGHGNLDRIKAARDAGVHEFLAKPIRPTVLYERLCDLIERPRKFVSCETYSGPDRQRGKSKQYRGPERRKTPREPP